MQSLFRNTHKKAVPQFRVCARYQSNVAFRPVTFPYKPTERSSFPARVVIPQRFYSGGPSHPSYEEVKDRVLDVVKAFEKVDASKVTVDSLFQKDLGLDSLDAVELIMAFEDEFILEIPDEDAEKMHSCADAIKYIFAHPHTK